MRGWVALVAALLACFVFQQSLKARGAKRYLKKESRVDMNNMNRVFIGWVDLRPDDWAMHGYAEKEEWAAAVNRLNYALQRMCQSVYLPGRAVTVAKDVADTSAAGNDLYIKFSDVWIDYNDYYLYVAIHFIDPKTNTEIATVPRRPYYGNDWGFERYLRAAMEEVSVKIQVEVLGARLRK